MDVERIHTDVLIIGSGPIGCTYARTLLEQPGIQVTMVDMGSQQSSIKGENLKNVQLPHLGLEHTS
jgi:2-polyprenyl-6-methoxyphenol hydroxylase-like FAD-dependent oxidoreductase